MKTIIRVCVFTCVICHILQVLAKMTQDMPPAAANRIKKIADYVSSPKFMDDVLTQLDHQY